MTPVSSDGKGSPDSGDKDDNTCNVGHYMYEDPSDPDGKRTKQPDSAMRECIDEDPSATKEFHDHEEKRVLPEFLQGTVLSGSFYRNLAEDYLLPRKHKGSDKNFDYCMVLPANEDGTGMYLLYISTNSGNCIFFLCHTVCSFHSKTNPCFLVSYIHVTM